MSIDVVIVKGQVVNRPEVGRISTLSEEINKTIADYQKSVNVSSVDVKQVTFPSAASGGDALLLFEYEGQKKVVEEKSSKEKPKKGRR